MTGRPILREGLRKLNEIGEDKIFAELAAGMTTRQAIKHFGCTSNRVFYKWLDSDEGRRDRYMSARKMWADMLAEETIEIADGAIDAHDATVRKLRIESRKWVAARVNPDNWAERKDPLLNITLGDQHLNALKDLIAEGREDAEGIEFQDEESRDRAE
mgnify:FL=1|tara:strand:- start:1 stop:474 length:474 start_codon:yes stop_codon:yes gene_type:complete